MLRAGELRSHHLRMTLLFSSFQIQREAFQTHFLNMENVTGAGLPGTRPIQSHRSLQAQGPAKLS